MYDECRYAECSYAESRHAECRYTECCGAVIGSLFFLLVKQTWLNRQQTDKEVTMLLKKGALITPKILLKLGSNSCQFLPPGVNFTNILKAAFAPKSFCQKITNQNCKHIEAAQKNLSTKKLLIKCW